MTNRILIHVQHLLGVGHLRRAAALSRAFARSGYEVVVLSGGRLVAGTDVGGGRLVQLAPAHAADVSFSAVLDDDGKPIDEAFERRRREVVVAETLRFAPDVVVTEHYPFGRRRFRGEITALFDAAPRGALVLSSVRDVLVRSAGHGEKAARIVDLIRKRYDGVLVHGDPGIIALTDSFPAADGIADRLHYTGYVVEEAPGEVFPADTQGAHTGCKGPGEVVVSVGGGAVGLGLLGAALEARRGGLLDDRRWRLLVGRNLGGAAFAQLRASAPDGVVVEWARPDFRALLSRASLSISQAGYNTLMDILIAGVPAVVVPFEAGAESEQRERAELFARRGLLAVLPESELDGRRLAVAALEAIVRLDRVCLSERVAAIRLEGADESVRIVTRLLGRKRRGEAMGDG